MPPDGRAPDSVSLRTPHSALRIECGFTLLELLVAIFVLGVAVSGAVAAIYAAGRSADLAREKTVAADLAGDALADALYSAEEHREANAGALDFGAAPFNALPYEQKSADALGPAGCQKKGERYAYGWLWRAHSFDAAAGVYSLDVWVFRHPTDTTVLWGYAPDSDAKRRQTLFYARTRLETRKP